MAKGVVSLRSGSYESQICPTQHSIASGQPLSSTGAAARLSTHIENNPNLYPRGFTLDYVPIPQSQLGSAAPTQVTPRIPAYRTSLEQPSLAVYRADDGRLFMGISVGHEQRFFQVRAGQTPIYDSPNALQTVSKLLDSINNQYVNIFPKNQQSLGSIGSTFGSALQQLGRELQPYSKEQSTFLDLEA